MSDNIHLDKIRIELSHCVGRHVRLTSKEGRNNMVVYEGVIENAYHSVFVVKLDKEPVARVGSGRISFNYTDLLTKAVDLKLYRKTS